MRKIIILWATCRPITLLKTHSEWMKNADNPSAIETYLSVDTPEQAKMLPEFDVMITKNTKAGVCYPCYCLSSILKTDDKDIVIFASDDFFPQKGWDTFVLKHVDIDKPCVLILNDGIQKAGAEVVTIPIMNFSALQKMNGIIYSPVYSHLWSDVELYDVAQELGMIKDLRETEEFLMEHRHYCAGKRVKDYADILVDNKYREDKKIYEQRRTIPLSKKLEIPKEIVEFGRTKQAVFHKAKLSILICTITKRKAFLDKLLECLKKQLHYGVEILVEEDNGEMQIGKKRNVLLERAKGKYCCFIDDDDLVSDNYIKDILEAIEEAPDCCSLVGEMTTDGQNPVKFIHSLKYDKWFDEVGPDGKKIYYRCPNHLNVIKTEICKKVKFNDGMSFGEDKDFSQRVCEFLKKETVLKDSTYFYLYLSKKQTPLPVPVPVNPHGIQPPVVGVKEKPTFIREKNKFILNAPWRF